MNLQGALGKILLSDHLLESCIADAVLANQQVPFLDKAVQIQREEGEETVVNIYIYVNYRTSIPALAFDLQSQVQKRIRQMTGEKVSQVNVHVLGVAMGEEE